MVQLTSLMSRRAAILVWTLWWSNAVHRPASIGFEGLSAKSAAIRSELARLMSFFAEPSLSISCGPRSVLQRGGLLLPRAHVVWSKLMA